MANDVVAVLGIRDGEEDLPCPGERCQTNVRSRVLMARTDPSAATSPPVGFAAGLLLGMARVVQGAHFLSHNLWSGLVCWLVILALYLAIIGPPASSQPATNAPSTG